MIISNVQAQEVKPTKRLITVVNSNLFDKNDPFIYRPVGFKGEIDFSDSTNVKVKGQFAFDAWLGVQDGALFIQVTLGDQVVSMVPVKHESGINADWEQHKDDMLWTVNIDTSFDISNSATFNGNSNNKEVVLGFELQIFEEVFINNIGTFLTEEIYIRFTSDLKLYPFQTKFNYKNTFHITDNKTINLLKKITINSYNKTNTVEKLINNQTPVTIPLEVKFPDIKTTRVIDYLIKFNSLTKINFILKDLQYQISKYKKANIYNYQFKFNNDFSQNYNSKEIIIKNKLSYEYDPKSSSFISRPTDIGTFILEQNEKTAIKGQMVVQINGINHYLFFEYAAIPLNYDLEFDVK